jgi:HEAT repeat protein
MLGNHGKNREGLAVALPALYAAMMDRSQRIRAEAARAYGELAESASDDLPSLVHESFLVLFVDPYVIVHRAAINALRRVRLPQRLISDAISRLIVLIGTYASSRGDDEFLSDVSTV